MQMQSQTDTKVPSENEPSEPISAQPSVIDLSAIAEKYQASDKVMVLDLATFDASKLTLIEVLDMCEVAGVEIAQFTSLLGSSSSRPKLTGRTARLLYGLGWVIARRAQPGLTFAEVSGWKLEIQGALDPKLQEANRKRAQAIVNAARMTDTPPDQAGNLEMGILAAAASSRPRRRRKR